MTPHAGQFTCVTAIAAAAWILSACAQQGAPQGGPPDTTPPTVEMTSPGSADVFVAQDRGLTLQFTEPIEKVTLENGLTLSPSRGGAPEFKWSNGSRRVDISWADSLRDSTTYRVTVTNRVTDRRGNKLAEPYTFAYSTGDHVDRGEILGRIRHRGGKPESFDVFAYRIETMPDTFWLSTPDYATQSGTDARFNLPFLRGGVYRLLALTDANRNKRLDHGEQFALATRELTVGDEIPADSIDLYPTLFDTVPFTIKSCVATGPRLVTLSFTHPLDTSGAYAWMINSIDSTTRAAVGAERLGPTQKRPSAIALDGDWTVGNVYSFEIEGIWDQRGRMLRPDTCHCVFTAVADSTAPAIEYVFLPSTVEALTTKDALVWVFSEPIDTTKLAGGLLVGDTAGIEIAGDQLWLDAQTLSFRPRAPWPDTMEVVATIDSSLLADRQGNPAKAGIYKWRFRPLGEESLGAIEGRTGTSLSSLPEYWIEAQELGKSRSTRIRMSGPGQFTLNLPAGRWQLGGFIDSDGDGRWSPGSLSPFSTPELRAAPSDTLDVRARFTLEDIILRF
jgi:hypothetical protein